MRLFGVLAAGVAAMALAACDKKDGPSVSAGDRRPVPSRRAAPPPPAWAGASVPVPPSGALGPAAGADPGRLMFDGQRLASGGSTFVPATIELGRRPPARFSRELPYLPRDLDLAEPPPPVVRGGADRYEPLRRELVGQGADPRVVDASIRQALAQGLDPLMVLAIGSQESGLRNGLRSSAGALGAMQVTPGTACEQGVCDRHALRYDANANTRAGTGYFRDLWDRFVGTPPESTEPLGPDAHRVAVALAAYNAGPGAVDHHGGVPPYQETQGYVRSVLDYYRAFRRYLTGG